MLRLCCSITTVKQEHENITEPASKGQLSPQQLMQQSGCSLSFWESLLGVPVDTPVGLQRAEPCWQQLTAVGQTNVGMSCPHTVGCSRAAGTAPSLQVQ